MEQGGLRVSKLKLAKSDGSPAIELTALNALGNILVERVYVSNDGTKFIYNVGKVISSANVDGTGNAPVKDVTADPQVTTW